jgi:hypothetical protein
MGTNNNTQLSIVDELTSKLTDIKDSMKKEGVTTTAFNQLSLSAKSIQAKIDELLAKGGVLTQSDINDGYIVLQNAKREELENLSKKANRRTLAYVIIGVVVLSTLFIITKKK